MTLVKETTNQTTVSVQIREVVIKAFSEEHARRIAGALGGFSMEAIRNVRMMSAPRKATTCKTDDNPIKGTRKWATVYQVYAYGQKLAVGANKYEYLNKELVQDDIEQKTEAVKIAKEMAIKHQLPMTVQIAQKLVSHDPGCADIEPKTTLGQFVVSYQV